MSDEKKIRWGLLACGGIARAFANGVKNSQTGVLAVAASRSLEKAQTFANKHDVPKAVGSYEEMLADPDVDAVYVSTPHPMHAEWAIKCAEAGKHILCEKPITLNAAEAMAVAQAARSNGVFLMEAFMYRCHPQTAKLAELVRDGAIGEVCAIHTSFSFRGGFNAEGRLFKNSLGGGGILDVGCYAVSMARLIAGAAQGKAYADPIAVQGMGKLLEETGVDGYAIANLKFPGDILAQVSGGVQVARENDVTIFGSEGKINVPSPWFCAGREGGVGKIIVNRRGEEQKVVEVECPDWLYSIEADTVGRALAEGKLEADVLTIDDTLSNMRALDMWRDSIGLVYDAEKPDGCVPTVYGRSIAKQPDAPMTYGRVPGIDKPVSRLVMGCDNQKTITHCAVMFDDFFEKGGNTFDTAFIYGGGLQEKLLGEWIRMRGVRDHVNVIAKGAHTPCCFPDQLTSQLLTSLERLQIDCAELYFMHRDNPDVPVGEFVDVLNEHLNAGRIKAFGGSNWSVDRLKAANAYAKENGLRGFDVVSNNFSLAKMVNPVWTGCVAASDPEQKAWFEETGTSLFSWSSQARGFFTDRAAPDKTSDNMLVRCWYSDGNFERRARAIELAREKGVEPISIAGAYVLCQKFPTFALIGPRQLSETPGSMAALSIQLTPQETAWLETGEGR